MASMSGFVFLLAVVSIPVVELYPSQRVNDVVNPNSNLNGKLPSLTGETFLIREKRSPEDFNSMLNNGMNTINQGANNLGASATGMLNSGLNNLNQAANGLGNQVGGMVNSGMGSLNQAGSGLSNAASNAWNQAGTGLNNGANTLMNGANNLMNQNFPSNGMPPLNGATINPGGAMNNLMNNAGNQLNPGMNGMWPTITTLYPGQITYNPNWNGLNNGVQNNNGLGNNVFGMISTTAAPATGANSWSQIKGVVGNTLTDMKNGFASMGNDVKNAAVNGLNTLNQMTNGQPATGMPNMGVTGTPGVPQPQGGNFFENSWQTVKGWFNG